MTLSDTLFNLARDCLVYTYSIEGWQKKVSLAELVRCIEARDCVLLSYVLLRKM